MLRWLLDDRPFDDLARHVGLLDLERWPFGSLAISGATFAEVNEQRSKLCRSGTFAPRPLVDPFDLPKGGVADSIVYDHLRAQEDTESEHLAEHQCIAYALTAAPDARFVVADKQAAFLALVELGPGRVASPFDLWLWLLRQGLIDRAGFDVLVEGSTKGLKGKKLPGIPWRFQHGV